MCIRDSIGGKTPCAVKGDKCYRCESPDNICHATVILERPVNGMKAEVVLICLLYTSRCV